MRVLLSIKPEFVEKIFSGEKRYEYRKAPFRRGEVSTVVVYATKPVGKIVGEFDIVSVLEDELDRIWERTKEYSGISWDFFSSYFSGKELGYAIKIGSPRRYSKAINPYVKKPDFTPPQSFCYLTD